MTRTSYATKKRGALLSLAAATLLATSMSASAAIELLDAKKDWASGVVHGSSSSLFRAMGESNNEAALVFINQTASSCSSPQFSIFLETGSILPEGHIKKGVDVELRVDRNPVHRVKGTLLGTKGEDGYSIYLNKEDSTAIKAEMRKGQALRARLPYQGGKESIYFTFSLSGSAYSIDRAERLCKQAEESQDSPEAYFPN